MLCSPSFPLLSFFDFFFWIEMTAQPDQDLWMASPFSFCLLFSFHPSHHLRLRLDLFISIFLDLLVLFVRYSMSIFSLHWPFLSLSSFSFSSFASSFFVSIAYWAFSFACAPSPFCTHFVGVWGGCWTLFFPLFLLLIFVIYDRAVFQFWFRS